VKTTALTLALVPAVALALTGVTGCSEQHASPTTPVAAAASPEPERLTLDVARRAFRAYVTNDDVARASGDERLALSWTGDGQSQLTAAAFRKAAFTGDPVPRFDYGAPELYVPRLSTYPQWFVAVAERSPRVADAPEASGRAPESPAARAKADRAKEAAAKSQRTAIMAFSRSDPSSRWRLSLSTLLDDKAELPEFTVDQEGYASALATFDGGLVIQPRGVPAIQATLAEEGATSVAAKVMRTGRHTSDHYTETRKAKKRAKDAGLAYDTVFRATSYPIYALRTVGNGGFVLYALEQNTVTFVRDAEKGHLAIPREAAHLLDTLVLQDQLDVSETLQFAAVVPATVPNKDKETQPKADVIASDGAATMATTN
jgi:hypothetical protein